MPSSLTKKELSDVIQWDIKNWKRTLVFWKENFEVKKGMKVLAIGEREGGLSLYFAKMGCEVLCTDFNGLPDSTIDFHKKEKVDHSISYKEIDICDIDLADDLFDVVVFKSVIGAVGNKKKQLKGISEINRVLKKDGALLFAENAMGTKLHQKLRNKFNTWNKYWRYPCHDDFVEWGNSFSSFELKYYGFLATFGRSEKQRNFISIFDLILSPILPKKWKYIAFAVMIK